MSSTSYFDYLPGGELSVDYQDYNSLTWPYQSPWGASLNIQVSGPQPFRSTQQWGVGISKGHQLLYSSYDPLGQVQTLFSKENFPCHSLCNTHLG